MPVGQEERLVAAQDVIRLHRDAGVPVSEAKEALEANGTYELALQSLIDYHESEEPTESDRRAEEVLGLRLIRRRTGLSPEQVRDLLMRADGDVSRALHLTNRISAREAVRRLQLGRGLSGVEVHDLTLNGEFGRLRFEGVTLVRPVFNGVRAERLEIKSCKVSQAALTDLVVEEDVPINRSQVESIRWRRGSVGGRLNLSDSEFGTVSMRDITIAGRIRAWESRFTGWVELRGIAFLGLADFRSLTCEQGLLFSECVFENDLLMRGTQVQGRFDLADSELNGCVDLERSKLYDFVYLEHVQQGSGQTWRFLNMLGRHVLIGREQVEGRLTSELQGDFETAAAEYSLLRRIWGDLDRHQEEDWAFHNFKVASRHARSRSWRNPWSKISGFFEWLLLDKGCGYGTNPLRALYTGAVVVVLFGFVYAAGSDVFMQSEAAASLAPSDDPGDRLVFGLLMSASVFAANFEQVALVSGWMALAVITEAGLGLLLFGLFVVAFSERLSAEGAISGVILAMITPLFYVVKSEAEVVDTTLIVSTTIVRPRCSRVASRLV